MLLCVSTEQVCEVLARRVGSEGVRRHARSQRPRDDCTRLQLKRAQAVQSGTGKFVWVCMYKQVQLSL